MHWSYKSATEKQLFPLFYWLQQPYYIILSPEVLPFSPQWSHRAIFSLNNSQTKAAEHRSEPYLGILVRNFRGCQSASHFQVFNLTNSGDCSNLGICQLGLEQENQGLLEAKPPWRCLAGFAWLLAQPEPALGCWASAAPTCCCSGPGGEQKPGSCWVWGTLHTPPACPPSLSQCSPVPWGESQRNPGSAGAHPTPEISWEPLASSQGGDWWQADGGTGRCGVAEQLCWARGFAGMRLVPWPCWCRDLGSWGFAGMCLVPWPSWCRDLGSPARNTELCSHTHSAVPHTSQGEPETKTRSPHAQQTLCQAAEGSSPWGNADNPELPLENFTWGHCSLFYPVLKKTLMVWGSHGKCSLGSSSTGSDRSHLKELLQNT